MSPERPTETEAERADRNFGDLLQEIRVAQTGVQILFAFLLTLPLQARFEKLDDWEIGTFVAALLLAAGASVCLIAPVAYHRALVGRKMKHKVVAAASRFAIVGLLLLALAITCAVDLVLDLVLGRTPALLIASGLAALLLLTWGVLPLAKLYGAEARDNQDDQQDDRHEHTIDLTTVPDQTRKTASEGTKVTSGAGGTTKEH
jgi:hypothetical protein